MTTDVRKHYAFAADRPVRNPAAQGERLRCEVICLEPGQSLVCPADPAPPDLLYVLEGTGAITVGERSEFVSAGGLAAVERGVALTIADPGPGRLAVLAITAK